jgi:hypothetical protein
MLTLPNGLERHSTQGPHRVLGLGRAAATGRSCQTLGKHENEGPVSLQLETRDWPRLSPPSSSWGR